MNKTIFLPHGGGPLPLMNDQRNQDIVSLFKRIGEENNPDLIIIFSAHHTTDDIHVIYDNEDTLTYDYYGFPPETYEYKYRPKKDIKTGKEIVALLNHNGITALPSNRGFDHGVFVPLMIMYPEGNIPVIQISLHKSLNPLLHIKLGEVLRQLGDRNILFLGSGFSFHNMRSFFQKGNDIKNDDFHDWLIETISTDMDEYKRKNRLIQWEDAPNAKYAHPTSEHLIPLHISYGLNKSKGKITFDQNVLNKRTICVEW